MTVVTAVNPCVRLALYEAACVLAAKGNFLGQAACSLAVLYDLFHKCVEWMDEQMGGCDGHDVGFGAEGAAGTKCSPGDAKKT